MGKLARYSETKKIWFQMERVEPYYYRRLLSILAQNTDDNVLLFFMNKAAAAKTKFKVV